jgi:hypothetical protein
VGRRELAILLGPATALGAVAGIWEVLTTVPHPWGHILVGAGVLWLAVAVGWIARTYKTGGGWDKRALADADFLLEVLRTAMPPLFIKVWDDKETKGKHIFENQAFDRVQDAKGTFDVEDERRALIRQDHHRGDLAALDEGSVQLEISDRRTGASERPILTTKTCITYRRKKYIVGWFVPVCLDGAVVGPADVCQENVRVREHGFQIVFRLARAAKDARAVPVGEALRPAAPASNASPARSAATADPS